MLNYHIVGIFGEGGGGYYHEVSMWEKYFVVGVMPQPTTPFGRLTMYNYMWLLWVNISWFAYQQ